MTTKYRAFPELKQAKAELDDRVVVQAGMVPFGERYPHRMGVLMLAVRSELAQLLQGLPAPVAAEIEHRALIDACHYSEHFSANVLAALQGDPLPHPVESESRRDYVTWTKDRAC